MEQLTLNSKNVHAAWYDTNESALIVEFSRGLKKYRYGNVTVGMKEQFVAAPSAGAWIHENLRGKDQHPCTTI